MIFPLFLASLALRFKHSIRDPGVPRNVCSYFCFSLKRAIFFPSLPYYRARRSGKTDSAVLQIAVPAHYFSFSKIFIPESGFKGSSTHPTWLSDNCADKPLSWAIWYAGWQGWSHHFYCPAAFILSCCGPSMENTGKRKIARRIAIDDIYSQPVAPTLAALVCIVPSTGPWGRLTRKGKISSLGS